MNRKARRGALTAAAAAVAAVALLATGCGSGNSSAPAGQAGTGTGATIQARSDFSAKILSTADLYRGNEAAPPTTGPAPAKGKSVWWVSCGMAIVDCSGPANAAKEAAQKLGWNFHIADGQLNQGGGDLKATEQAIAAGADAIIVHGISCPIIESALLEAKQKHIPVLGAEALDCSDTGGPHLFTAEMKYSPTMLTGADYFTAWGVYAASYIIDKAGEHAKIILNQGTEPLQAVINTGFVDTLKACTGCAIASDLKFSSADLTPNGPWIQAFRTSLLQHASATAIYFPFDVNIVGAGGARAVQASGLHIVTAGGSGSAAALDLVRQGLQDMVIAHSPEWLAYGAMDELNRIFAGQPTVPEGVGLRVVDKAHNLPAAAGGAYESPINWLAAYDKLWGRN
jgi:ribose transport system substrate-binding protein